MLAKTLLKYGEVSRTYLRSQWAYVWDQLLSGFHLVILMFIFHGLWKVTFAGADTVNGYTLAEMVWYVFATELIILSLPRIHAVLEGEVRNGDLAIRLNKPVDYLLFHFSSTLGEAFVRLFTTAVIGGVTTFLLVGPFGFAWHALPVLLLVYLTTYLLNFCYQAMIGLSAFWTEDSAGIYLVADRLKWILGGFLLPLDVFPEQVRAVVNLLPFREMIYAPARLFVKFTWTDFGQLALRQSFWVAVMVIAVYAMYGRGVRKVDINGG